MSLLFQQQFLGPLPNSGGIWSIGRHTNISGFTQIPFCSTSSLLQSLHSSWLEKRRRAQLLSCGPELCQGMGQGRGTGASITAAGAAVALIRDWPSKPVSCIVHQRRSASQPESQMIQAHAKLLKKKAFTLLSLPSSFNSASPTHL